MGIIYWGPYADAINAGDHEGYAARLMPDGTLSGSWGGEYGWDNHIGLVAACDCGWRGPTVFPADDMDSPAYNAATDEWDREHLQPMIERARATYWPAWAKRTASYANEAAAHIAAGRHADAVAALGWLIAEAQAAQRVADEIAQADERRSHTAE